MTNLKDPIQGLIDYVLEVKPFHTKIIETLVTYVQEDFIDVSVSEMFEVCINIGRKKLASDYVIPFISVDTTTNTFTIADNETDRIFVGQRIDIVGSTDNDGEYYVTDVMYDILQNQTTVTLREPLISNTADGAVASSTYILCPGKPGILGKKQAILTNIHESPIECIGGFGEVFDEILFKAEIIGVSAGTKTFSVIGDFTTAFTGGNIAEVAGSTGNDGRYEIASSIFTGTVTEITVVQPIPSSVIDGGFVPVYDIVGTNALENEFIISGNRASEFPYKRSFEVKFTSNGNDGIYTTLTAKNSGTNTVITTLEDIQNDYPPSDPVSDGDITVVSAGFDGEIVCDPVEEGVVNTTVIETLKFDWDSDVWFSLLITRAESSYTDDIVAFDSVLDTISVNGDRTADYTQNTMFIITNSGSLNGIWSVASDAIFNGSETIISVTGNITNVDSYPGNTLGGNAFTVLGDQRSKLPTGSVFEVTNSTGNDGLYRVNLTFLNPAGNTVVFVLPSVKTVVDETPGGFITTDAPATLTFSDIIGVSTIENTNESVIVDGSMIDPFGSTHFNNSKFNEQIDITQ